ncbi:MAG: HD domain-containing protein [Lentihominibacter sp.]
MKSGYWRTDFIGGGLPNRVFHCDEHYVTYRYDGDGKWSRLDRMPDFGWSDEYEPISEEEALEQMKVFDSEDFAPDADAAEYISRSIGKFLHQREIDAEYSRNPTLKLHEAIRFAEEMHRGQKRKGTDIDYIIHPMEVLAILMGEGCTIETAIAGVLHDVLEDTPAKAEEIEARFGSDVLRLVEAHSERKSAGGVKRPWRIRKDEDLARLRQSDFRVKQIVMADSISNLRSMKYDYESMGEELWERFNAPKDSIAWYYSEKIDILDGLKDRSDTAPDYWEMNMLFKELFVEFYNDGDALYQAMGDEIYALRRGSGLAWEEASRVPESAERISREECEKLEDYWVAIGRSAM